MNTLNRGVLAFSKLSFTTLCLIGLSGPISGCGGGASGGSIAAAPAVVSTPAPSSTTTDFLVQDVNGKPIGGAVISVSSGGTQLQATTAGNGTARISGIPIGDVTLIVSAANFETTRFTIPSRQLSSTMNVTIDAVDAWAVGRAIVLGSRALERAADGSTLTFSVDVAVVGRNSAVIENLGSKDFAIQSCDSAWSLCATDAAGKPTAGDGQFNGQEGADAFGLQPPGSRRPYVVGMLAERSTNIDDWDSRVPALKSFFSSLGRNDAASLATIETINGAPEFAVLGPYTNDGRTYLNAIDQLARTAGQPPPIFNSLKEEIARASAARNTVTNGAQPVLLVLAKQGLTVAEINAATELARQQGVQVSVVAAAWRYYYGLTELAARSGGFVAHYEDPRQLEMIFGAMDAALAGSLRFYRMNFRINGAANVFVAGGNAKVVISVRLPTLIPARSAVVEFDVAIP